MRARQLTTRLRRRVPLRVLAAGTAAPGPVPFRPLAAGSFSQSAPQSGPVRPPDTAGVFTAVGASRAAGAPGFWTDPADGLLFLFTLHGFGELARYAAGPRNPAGERFWSQVVEHWLRECGRPATPAWHPYPTSERLLSWSAALSAGEWPSLPRARMTRSMLQQARVLGRSVEHDIGGNHVLRNAAALTVSGACLGEAGLLQRGLALYARELAAQILPDGGHEERSPSYHRLLLEEFEDVLGVLERGGVAPPAQLIVARERMAAWQAALTGPDGGLPMLNDGWAGPPLAARRDEPLSDLPATGYVVLRHGGDQAVLDVAPLAPAHLPPHAHADALSFVLWMDGELIVADPGSFAYTGPERSRFRGTSAHATVEVDGRDQCDLWGDFRAAHMPRVRRTALEQHDGGAVVLRAEHDGYRRLPDPVVHERTWCWLAGEGLVVVDRLRARMAHGVRTRLPLAPGIRFSRASRAGPLKVAGWGAGDAPVAERPAEHAPFIGTGVPAIVLERELTPAPGEPFGWTLLRDPTRVEVGREGGCVLVRRAGRPDVDV